MPDPDVDSPTSDPAGPPVEERRLWFAIVTTARAWLDTRAYVPARTTPSLDQNDNRYQ